MSVALDDLPAAERWETLLQPEPHGDGTAPEVRTTHGSLSWDRYLALDRARGERGAVRLYFLEGVLEVMTLSAEHERLKKWIDKMVEIFLEERGIEQVTYRGQATMRDPAASVAAEPDEAWCFGAEKEQPGLVLEIALNSGGLRKLEIYRRFRVPEVWVWEGGGLSFYRLRDDASGYESISESRALAGLPRALVERCARIQPWAEARRIFRSAL